MARIPRIPHDETKEIWECDCAECIRLDWQALDGVEDISLTEFWRQRLEHR